MELPIRFVVLLIVGMAGLAAILSALSSFSPPQSMHADVLGISGNASMIETGNGTAYVDIEVIATGGSPVPGATVLLRGNNVTASGVTDDDGKVMLGIDRSAIMLDIEEGYLRLIAKAEGYMEYSNEHAVKVIRP